MSRYERAIVVAVLFYMAVYHHHRAGGFGNGGTFEPTRRGGQCHLSGC
jgi:hypothetical protein